MKIAKLVTLLMFGFSTAAFGAAPTDAEIAAIVVTANQVDVDAGELAKKASKNKEIRDFADRMITDHKAVNKSAIELVTKLKVTPKESDISKSLKADGEKARKKLSTLKGAAFDLAYVNNEVAYHQAVLDAIDQTLAPSAQNAELKALIGKVRPAIAAHLDHAKKIQTQLAKK